MGSEVKDELGFDYHVDDLGDDQHHDLFGEDLPVEVAKVLKVTKVKKVTMEKMEKAANLVQELHARYQNQNQIPRFAGATLEFV